jgi:hypothetical protein
MAPGKVSQQLYLTSLPEGAVFTVTSITTPKTDSFYTYFNKTAPFSIKGALTEPTDIGESVIQSQGVLDHGTPPQVTLAYTLQLTINKQPTHKTGYLNICTTEFGRIFRPDYSTLTFNIENQAPRSIEQDIHDGQAPDPIHIAFAINSDQVLMNAIPQHKLSTEVLSKLIGGVEFAHENVMKLFSL